MSVAINDCGDGTAFESAGRGDQSIRGLILHSTAGSNSFDHRIFMGWEPGYQVSIHYYILKSGEIRRYVRDRNTAWHTGDSFWNGVADFKLNQATIGTELENRNTGKDPYTEAQIASCVGLWRELTAEYNIKREWCARHRDISPGRKTDPAGFPWANFLDRVYTHGPATGATQPLISGIRTYRVAYAANVRTDKSTNGAVVDTMGIGAHFACDEIVFGENVGGSVLWMHRADGRGFTHVSCLEPMDSNGGDV
jgi:N-acetyl-anhydromuramyl-L-alanine amidase AmpD